MLSTPCTKLLLNLSSATSTQGNVYMEKLLALFGSQKAVADALGVSKAAVSQWFKDGALPPARALEIVRMTKGAITLKELIGE